MSEFDIIKKYFLPLTNGCKASGFLCDDAALISVSAQKELVISKDLIAEDIHFTKSDGACNIAKKLLSSNLSDLAASGAKPLYYMLGFSQENLDEEFIKEFCYGLKTIGDKFKIDLIGGDSVRSKNKLFFSLTIFGEVKKGKYLKRNSAQDGDLIFVSGNIGDAFLGLNLNQKKITCQNNSSKEYLIGRHLNPTPRISLGLELVKNNIKSAIDISDGLLADLKHICQASNLSAKIHQNLIPISASAKRCLKENKNIDLNELFSGGEDYELIFTVDKKYSLKIKNLTEKLGIRITQIGSLERSKSEHKIHLLDQNNEEIIISQYGWQHY
jgi:thiamine-monophosphate kinase